ncbi:type I phosphomannose isomerase catalytic subunit [Clostridium magnum]|uniref:Phosphohexomutase n=1 Tax=Clostridium magnum DSM 2767 TaxID=1121326 RepID=A0A161X6V2_9CLOT|nr:type I phosphomannose isomerase catalytic subunit [Clostridium magnum]KZL89816.1 mannose-6-phosphate isomerase ManA [Clostridium magnum DSM 2767]SHI69214.1 mannose-6-phosphate isomerase, type 1 [Clostridium magnum DSM 2767]
MYPIKFKNIYFDKIWGGRDLELFRDNLPEGDIGESWDVACHPHGMSIVKNGEFKGTKLDELIKLKGSELLGTKIFKETFPLLIKLINAKDKLSVQVHPEDKYAMETEGEMGKTEVWYVVEALTGANLVVGTKEGCTKEQFKKAIEEGKLEEYMNKIPVKKGEVYFVKSGLIHAIGEGVIIAEIQQNSDTTYRVYDYNRGRELHVEKALDVVDLDLRGERSTGVKVEGNGHSKVYYCVCDKFSLELYDVYEAFSESSDEERFYVFTCVEGNGKIIYNNGSESIEKGESIFIPASLGDYRIEGNLKLLKSYVPDIEKLKSEILEVVMK